MPSVREQLKFINQTPHLVNVRPICWTDDLSASA